MFEATVNEFPFVEALPKREKGRVAKILETIREFSALQKEHGTLIPAPLAWGVLGVSRSRLYELVELKRLPGIQHHGQWYIPEEALLEFCKSERKAGRPPKVPTSNRDLLKISIEAAKEFSR